MDFQTLTILIPILGAIGLLYTFIKSSWVAKQDVGTERMAVIAKNISDGAMAFLKAEYRVLAIFVVVVAALLAWNGTRVEGSSWLVSVSFILGAICSALAGFIGMKVATKA
ncbi:MAG TPA: sodium-translocating pyrophosphatase, partial [Bacteroidetes bacterium]|nr:sodium-translocating pyrophosphatase [Bacteroidota bacterium]